MSGWSEADKMMEEDMPFDFPAVNNITIAGYLPHDKVPQSSKYSYLNDGASIIFNDLIPNLFVNSEEQDFH